MVSDRTLLERRKYAQRIFYLLVYWLLGVFVMLLLHGWKICGFSLTEPLLIPSCRRNGQQKRNQHFHRGFRKISISFCAKI